MQSSTSGTASASATAPAVLGDVVPRLYTPPLVQGAPGPCGCGCALTPDTSYGFDIVDWAETVLLYPADPWQRWALIHGLETLPDGRPRFRTLLIEVARQNGKTTLLVILSAWWQFVCGVPLILGTSTKLDYAKESWERQVEVVESAPALAEYRGRRWTRNANGEQQSWTTEKARYKIAPANEQGGRSLTVHRLILDELRHHYDYSAWGAAVNAGNAVNDFQVWGLSNAGSDRSVVMNALHEACEAFIDWAAESDAPNLQLAPGDWRTGMFSWSAETDADPLDVDQLAHANPSLGRRVDVETLLGAARLALAGDLAALNSFKTEVMCIRVRSLNSALDMGAWFRSKEPATLDAYRGRVALVLDVAPDMGHAILVAAALQDDGRVRVEEVASWSTVRGVISGETVDGVKTDPLTVWIERVRPYVFGWYPGGPAAALTSELADGSKRGRRGWPPRGIRVEPIRGTEPAAVCMAYAERIKADGVRHSGQDLLDAHHGNAERRNTGNGQWIFERKAGGGHVDGAYAAAGAAYLAVTVPAPRDAVPLRVVPD